MNRWATAGLLLAVGMALALRCPRVGQRPMHNDEGVNAVKFGQLWEGGGYKYDPSEYHGPSLPYATWLLNRVTGGPSYRNFSEARLRWVTVAFGVGLILILPLVTDGIGRKAVVWAAWFIAVSTAMVFYSRYYIHEMLLVFFSALALAAAWRYWRSRKFVWALLCGGAVGLMQATKETFVITLAAAGVALVLNQLWNHFVDASLKPVKSPALNLRHVAAGMGVWIVVAVLLFSSFLTNANGPLDAVKTYSHWLGRAGGNSPHIHGWGFYAHRLIFFHAGQGPVWSEALIVALAAIGGAAGFARKWLGDTNASFVRFLALYSGLLGIFYSFIAYKTPWCLLSFWLGFLILAGVGAAVLVRAARHQWARVAITSGLVIATCQLGAQAWQAAFRYETDQRNPYVYGHTSASILDGVSKIESLAANHPDRQHMVVSVVAPEDDYWPLPWYLRRFDRTGYYSKLPDGPLAPVLMVSSQFNAGLDEKKTHLMAGYFQLRPGVFFELYVELELWKQYLAKKATALNPQDSTFNIQ